MRLYFKRLDKFVIRMNNLCRETRQNEKLISTNHPDIAQNSEYTVVNEHELALKPTALESRLHVHNTEGGFLHVLSY